MVAILLGGHDGRLRLLRAIWSFQAKRAGVRAISPYRHRASNLDSPTSPPALGSSPYSYSTLALMLRGLDLHSDRSFALLLPIDHIYYRHVAPRSPILGVLDSAFGSPAIDGPQPLTLRVPASSNHLPLYYIQHPSVLRSLPPELRTDLSLRIPALRLNHRDLYPVAAEIRTQPSHAKSSE